jgi:hypothetical protein
MNVSSAVSLLSWISAILLAWFVVVERVQYSGLALGAWIFFIVVGLGAGIMSYSDTRRQ